MNTLESEYAKLHFAKFGFRECDEYLDVYENNANRLVGSDHAFQTAISKSFVITYSRPFTNNRNIGRLSERWTRSLSEELRKLHSDLIGIGRNVLVAHMDINELRAVIILEKEQQDSFIFTWPIPIINENTIPRLRELMRAARKYCDHRQQALRPQLQVQEIHVGS